MGKIERPKPAGTDQRRRRGRLRDHRAIVLAALLAVCPQTAPPLWAAARDASPALAGQAAELVVTAKQRPMPLLNFAGNTARLSGATIEALRADHPAEAFNRLPGVNLHRGNGQEHLTAIRSPVLTGGAGAGSFLFLEDGIALRAAGFANVNGLFEALTETAAAIEVIRGPGGALYGSNALHGVVNVISPQPEDGPRGFIDVTAGSFDRVRVRMIGRVKSRAHGLAVTSVLAHEGGYRDDSGVDQQKLSVRHVWSSTQWAVDTRFALVNLNQETAGFVIGPDAYRDRALAQTNPNPEAFRDARAARLSTRIERQRPNGSLTITPYGRVTDMAFLLHFMPSEALETNGHWSLGVLASRLWNSGGGHEFVVGFDTDYSRGFLTEVQAQPSFGGFPQGTHYDFTARAVTLAPYGRVEWVVAPGLRLNAGLRVERTAYDYDNRAAADTVGRFRRPADRRDRFVTVTPSVGAVVALGAETAAYVSLARGARAPQVAELYRLQSRQIVAGIDPELLDSFELGVRGRHRGFRYELVGFVARKTNVFFRDADGFNFSDGRTRHQGLEWRLATPVAFGLSLDVSGTFARHRYGFSRPVTAVVTESITRGDAVDTAPRWLANATLAWQPHEATRFELEWVHVGAYFTDAANAHSYPGHDLLNLRTVLRVGRFVEIFGAVRNLANKAFAERADFGFGSERYLPGEGRSLALGLTARI